jgi:hypothetical protein
MSNLPSIQQDLTPATAIESGNKVSEMPRKEGLKWVNTVLSSAIAMAGQEANNASLMGMVQGTMDMLTRQFKNFTAEEVVLAIKKGTYGLYGDYYKITIKEIGKWLISYKTTERAEVLRRRENQKLQNTLKANLEIKDPIDISARAEQLRKKFTSKL